jgi:hypothetical protein
MAKKIKRFTDEDDKELSKPNPSAGITEDDIREANESRFSARGDESSLITRGLPGQKILAAESEKRDYSRGVADRAWGRESTTPNTGQPDKEFARRMRVVVDAFKKAPAGPEKEKHRAMAWTMAEGIKRDSGEGQPGDLTPGRRTAIRFVAGQEMPCVNGPCNNTVPWEGPKTEPEGSPVTAGITTCSGGKCDIPAARIASRPAER